MSASQTQTQTPKKEQSYIVEEFLDLDPKHFTFQEAKENTHGGHFIGLRYKNKSLYVKYGARVCPFGVSTSNEEKPEYKGRYTDGKKITGYSTSISFYKDPAKDPYYIKAQELDEFFMEKCLENSMNWYLGGSKVKPMGRDAIEGYDDRGWNGKWKRLIKWSYKVDKTTKERVYLDYPPRMEYGIPTVGGAINESPGEGGLMHQSAIFKTVFFNAEGSRLDPVHSDDGADALPKFSRTAIMAQWSSITQGTYGASLKPKVLQVRVYPSEGLPNTDECLLDDEEEAEDLPDMLGGVPVELVTGYTGGDVVAEEGELLEEEEEEEEEGELLEEDEEEVVEEPEPVAVVPTRRTTRVVRAKTKA